MKEEVEVVIESSSTPAQAGWLELRRELWPHCADDEHVKEMTAFCTNPSRYVQGVAYSTMRQPLGFVEASLRTDYVNGTSTSPVAFLEGLYVLPEKRGKGIARALVARVEAWARAVGCRELASDALIDNHVSHTVHRALGFDETERVIYFRKSL